MKSLKFVRNGLSAAVVIAGFTACDGRGVTQFKAAHFAPVVPLHSEEPQSLDAKLVDPFAVPDKTGKTINPPDSTIAVPVTPQAPTTPSQPKASTGQAADTTTPKAAKGWENRERAEGHVFFEHKKLVDVVDSKIKSADEKASNIVTGIDFRVIEGRSSLELSIDARVELNGMPRNLFVVNNPIGVADEGKVEANLKIELGLIDGSKRAKAEPKTVIGYGFCREASCETIHVILDFGVSSNERAQAVFALQVDKVSGQFKVVQSNLAKLQAFCKASGDVTAPACKGDAPASEKPKDEVKQRVDTQPSVNVQDLQSAAQERRENEAATSKERQQSSVADQATSQAVQDMQSAAQERRENEAATLRERTRTQTLSSQDLQSAAQERRENEAATQREREQGKAQKFTPPTSINDLEMEELERQKAAAAAARELLP